MDHALAAGVFLESLLVGFLVQKRDHWLVLGPRPVRDDLVYLSSRPRQRTHDRLPESLTVRQTSGHRTPLRASGNIHLLGRDDAGASPGIVVVGIAHGQQSGAARGRVIQPKEVTAGR